MIALRLTMLLVAVALVYALFIKSQSKVDALPPEIVQTAPAAPGASPQQARTQYKEAMNRAHAAADAMKAGHADADFF